MDIITIFLQLFQWGVPALIAGILLLVLFAVSYRIYKNIFHGEKTFSKKQIISAFLLCCWAVLVIGLTALSRGANFNGSSNIDFLSGYISAWNHWSISELQLILFNMLMFVPLGFLLPILWKKAEKLWITLAVSFLLTASLETFQFLTGTGIFELDDLFHNMIGSLFGYFLVMAILIPIREKALRIVPIAKALLIPCTISFVLGTIFFVYDHQPYGNMSILPAVKQDMSGVQIVTEQEFQKQAATAAVYQNEYAEDEAYLQKVKTNLADLEHLTFSQVPRREDENIGFTGTDANGNTFQLLFFFRTGEWRYTTFKENASQLTEETIPQLKSRYEGWMKEQDLLPEKVEFSVQNGDTLRWDAVSEKDSSSEAAKFQEGSIMIQFDETGALSSFSYLIHWNTYAATENIISESQAFEQIKNGNFEQYLPFQPGDTLYINACKLSYLYDTKGFYQPVYEFSGCINSMENIWVAQIPALADKTKTS